MKRVFGKNQVIITALAIMIAVAGYLSITQDNAEDAAELAATETNGEVTADISDDLSGVDGYVVSDNGDIILQSQDATATSPALTPEPADSENATTGTDTSAAGTGEETGTEAKAEGEADKSADTAETKDLAGSQDVAETNNSGENAAASAENVGEAVLVSSVIGAEYFDSAKLSREQTRSKNKEILMELVNSTATTEAQREEAVTQIISLTSDSEKETSAEAMLEAKGFGKCIVSIVDGSVDVIVNANNLTEAEIAQIEDIVKRKTDAKAADIVITPVGVNTAE